MSTAQLQKEFLRLIKDLSKDNLEKILAFVEAVRQNEQSLDRKKKSYDLESLDKSQAAHLEEEFLDYKKRFPLE